MPLSILWWSTECLLQRWSIYTARELVKIVRINTTTKRTYVLKQYIFLASLLGKGSCDDIGRTRSSTGFDEPQGFESVSKTQLQWTLILLRNDRWLCEEWQSVRTCIQSRAHSDKLSQHMLLFWHSERNILVYLSSEGVDVINGNICVVFRRKFNVAL